MCNEVNVSLHSPVYEHLVFLSNRRQIYMDIRHIDALMAFDQALIHDFANQFSFFLAYNRQIN
mgnify:CR=1 FL=1